MLPFALIEPNKAILNTFAVVVLKDVTLATLTLVPIFDASSKLPPTISTATIFAFVTESNTLTFPVLPQIE